MIPVVTPAQMRAVDADAPEGVAELISRAGAAVARHALEVLGGAYGRTVHVIAGPGDNGADGRDAAERLRRRGVRVVVHDVGSVPAELVGADLVVDAAFGTGYRADPDRPWIAPDVGDAPVLAVDVPSGIDAHGVAAAERILRARRTVTFQALKPGLVLADGARLAGEVHVADIGLDVSRATCHLVESSDVARWWPERARDAHKWDGALAVIAGSADMPGAAELCTAAAARAGSGLVSCSSPGARPRTRSEIVQTEIGESDFAAAALERMERFSALVIGPGLGRAEGVLESVRRCVAEAPVPVLVDGDAITAIAAADGGAAALIGARSAPTVLTPHDGEFRTLTGELPGADRVAAARGLAAELGATVLLKGPTTIVASGNGDAPVRARDEARALLVDRGDERLATAGSGDVLSGIVGALLASGVDPVEAAAAGAWIHGAASDLGPARGLLAGDIVDLLPAALGSLR
ncbi:NAD(P)H-hydrate dehydratase [Ilumatobacter sp.]|uniref:NAD(P)H-hydrate dehydratase n=1 Tax=Ilumatobacter sp. TaxID=1967498 RepID=UPI003B51F8AB